jgi:hypothetical protein
MWIFNVLTDLGDTFLDIAYRRSAQLATRTVLDSKYGKGQWEIVHEPLLGEVVYLLSEGPLLRASPVLRLQARARACELSQILSMPRDQSLQGILDFRAIW